MNRPREYVTEPGQLNDIEIPAFLRAAGAPLLGAGPSIETGEADARQATAHTGRPLPCLFLTLELFDAEESKPDAELTVLVWLDGDDEPMWLGYFDGKAWCNVEGSKFAGRVTHYAEYGVPTRHRG